MYEKLPIFVLGFAAAGMNLLYLVLYRYQEFKLSGIIIAGGLYQIPCYGKTFKIVSNVALRIMNIFPGSVGIYKPDYSFYSRYKNIA